MPESLIVIAGSADPKRTNYEPRVDIERARKAARELGVALAKARSRIVVYHCEFIEADVVAGYTSVRDALEKGILVRYPQQNTRAACFREAEHRSDVFDFKGDPTCDWEASYYRSLHDADGVILIGGGTSVVVTGHLALGFRIPLLALATFGGGAQKVWNAIVPDRDLPTETERERMAAPTWTAESADRCLAVLNDQCARRQRERAEQTSQANVEQREKWVRHILALGLLIGSMGVLMSAFLLGAKSLPMFLALMFLGPCMSGASGSITRAVWTEEAGPVQTLHTVVLGVGAGAISAALYFVTQLVANPNLLKTTLDRPELPTALIVLAVITGWIAGFTFDLVFTKLAKTEVTRTKVIV
jgi:hypothetical protein